MMFRTFGAALTDLFTHSFDSSSDSSTGSPAPFAATFAGSRAPSPAYARVRSPLRYGLLAYGLVGCALLGCGSSGRGRSFSSDGGAHAFPSATYRTSCDGFAGECWCSAGTVAPTSFTCDSAGGTAVCCGDVGWPDTSLQCRCSSFSCKAQNGANGDTCACSTTASGNKNSCVDDVCCLNPLTDNCHCGAQIACTSYETAVTQCDASVVTCHSSSTTRVAACSVE